MTEGLRYLQRNEERLGHLQKEQDGLAAVLQVQPILFRLEGLSYRQGKALII